MRSKSGSWRPRLVMAGAPMRTPPGASALTSPTTAFLFSVMCTRSHAFSILFPLMPCSQLLCLTELPGMLKDLGSSDSLLLLLMPCTATSASGRLAQLCLSACAR